MEKVILRGVEPGLNANSEELANVLIQRMGLTPRKKGATEKMHKVLLELYERSKEATRHKEPTRAVITVEEMGYHAGITRQTMYEYLRRWLELDLITKTSYIDQYNKAIIGYKLNGATIELAFEKATKKIHKNLEETQRYIGELQKLLKNEKISNTSKIKKAKELSLEKQNSKNVDDNVEEDDISEEKEALPEEEEVFTETNN